MSSSIDQVITKETSPGANGVLAVGTALVRSGQPPIIKSFGRQSHTSATSVSPASAFMLYSITKPLTAVAALQCVSRGQIGLDDAAAVHALLPELDDLQLLSVDEDGKQTLAPPAKPRSITLRMLLAHTSGIGIDAMDPRLQAWRAARGEPPLAFCGRGRDAYALPLLFEPGAGWAYGGGPEWAGLLVERLNGGVRLGEYMREHIFAPLGMTDATFRPARDGLGERLVEHSVRTPDGGLAFMPPAYPADEAENDSGAVGLVATVDDVARFTEDMLREEPTVLKRELVEELFRPQFGADSGPARALGFGAVMFGRLIGEEYDPEKVSQCLGAFKIVKDTRLLPAGTVVMTGIPNLVWFANREKGVGGLYASAVMPPDDAKSTELITAFLKHAFENDGDTTQQSAI